MSERRPIVAIDGPAGSGKSTAARRLAERFGYVLIDTGALYRAVALIADERGVSWDDAEALGRLASELDLEFGAAAAGSRPPLYVGGVDRSGELRTEHISQGASKVSAHPPVRAALLDVQRRMGAAGGVVLEGRDIGTVVFPNADVKVFLTASDEARAQRRHAELVARGHASDLSAVQEEMRTRDRRDSTRLVAPLKRAEDAIFLDTSALSLDDVVDRLAEIVERAGFSPD